MSKVLVYSERVPLAAELLTAAAAIAGGEPVTAACIDDPSAAEELAALGAQACHLQAGGARRWDTAAVAAALAQAVQHTGAQVLLLASNRRGRELAGRVAQALEAGCLTDVMALEVRDGQLLAVRNALGGAVLATQRVLTPRQVMALAPGAWPAAAPAAGGTVQELKVEVPSSPLRLVETRPRPAAEADIEGARVLVAVGLGLAPEDLPLAQQVAQALGGEIACSKPVATDRKWLPEERVIGLSGKKCKPELALLLGISGQVQFTVGIRDARTIVAVNRDENAPILTMADYAMVADLKDVLPALGPGL